ncbi:MULTISPECIES: hypothetical protein [Bacillus]|jgi:hypothetical protein|uniref:hypothetical protein n=1 Tax=Bacillus TaxID=1386 RepID=UPI000C777520|nr:hypothetical protein [Bacillus sp. UMB0728]PLR70128.1 hypothetical protein CYJ37_25740 [Bacillus sp. UMB0728]
MTESLKKSINLYTLYTKEVVLIGLLFVFPIQLVFTFYINYITAPFQYFGIPLWTSLLQLLFILILFPFIQIPYISLIKYDMLEDEVSMKKIIGDIFKNGFHVYILGIITAILSLIGFLLFIVPGIVLMIFFLCVPQTAVLNNAKWGSAMKKSIHLGWKKFLSLTLLVLFFILVDSIISGATFFLSAGLTNSFFIINALLIFINCFIIPVFIFSISYIYINKEIESKGNELFTAHISEDVLS